MRVILCFLSVLVLAPSTWGQSATASLSQIVEAYRPSQTLECELQIEFFDQLDSKLPVDKQRMKLIRNGQQFYSKIGTLETVTDGKILIQIDHGNKTIVLQKSISFPDPLGVDQFVSYAEQNQLYLVTFDPGNQRQGLRFEAPQSSNTRIDIIYDPQTMYIDQTEMRIDVPGRTGSPYNKSRIRTTYLYHKIRTGAFPHRPSDYLESTGGQYRPKTKYQDYELIQLPGSS